MIAWTIIGQINQNAPAMSGSIGIALNRPEQLRAHLERARANGVTKDEIIEIITHLAFYAGWRNAVNAVAIAREVYH
jgi:4-carboxymuconolactone decarboxylase